MQIINPTKTEFYESLNNSRNHILEKIKEIFELITIESHILGSVARGNPDAYSDLDIWLTVDDSNWDDFSWNRLKYISQLGEVIHLCEPPQNAPFGGIFTTVFIKQNENIIVTDFYFCPKSFAFVTNESLKMFGEIDLPKGELSLNSQKIIVPETYRIDFLICFIFGTIKKIVRKNSNALLAVLDQYENLSSIYGIETKKIPKDLNPIETLIQIISNTKEVSTPKQSGTLDCIEKFILKVATMETDSI